MNQERRLRRLRALKKVAAVKSLHPEDPPPEHPQKTDEEMIAEYMKSLEEGEQYTEDIEGTGIPFSEYSKKLPESRRGPLSQHQLQQETQFYRTFKPVSGEDGPEQWVASPEDMSTYERYFGLKTPDGWRPTPISNLLFAAAVNGTGDMRDPSRGQLNPPGGDHPYVGRFGKLRKMPLLKEDVEQQLIMDARSIFQALNEVQPSLVPGNAIRSETKIRMVSDSHGRPGWEVSGTRHQNVLVPFNSVSPSVEKEYGQLEGLLGQDLEEFPELAEMVETVQEDVSRVVQQTIRTNPRLRGRLAHPGGREKVRDLLLRLIQTKVDEAINEMDLE